MTISHLDPEFVEFIPASGDLRPSKLYISEVYLTAVHLCCCGCGREVVTPLNAAKWQLSRCSGGVSLRPSIGNWAFPCRSHYFITNNGVVWAEQFSDAQIASVQDSDRRASDRLVSDTNAARRRATNTLWDLLSRGFRWFVNLFK